jgi:hypothetical protein
VARDDRRGPEMITPAPDPRDKRLHSPDRLVRMREKIRRMPPGTFTFAGHLSGIEKRTVHEALVDEYLLLAGGDAGPSMLERRDDAGNLLVRFRRME